MKRKLLSAILCCAGAFTLSAQVEVPAPEQTAGWLNEYKALCSAQGTFQTLLKNLDKASDKVKTTAVRVAKDFPRLPAGTNVVSYSVPAMSETQYLPDVYPFDGKPGTGFRIIAAQNEYEPGAVLLYPLKSFGKVAFEVSDLKSEDGAVFSKKDLDLKTVKVWYQNGNGWYSYFQDKTLKLCPELLLNDEDLIKVDTQKKTNYARLTEEDGKVSYRWLNPPPNMDYPIEDATRYRRPEGFPSMKPNFKDAETFQGATLDEARFKEFFLTAHVKDNQKPGLYKGAIALKKDGKQIASIPVELRVLPFSLPKPATYFDTDKEFLVYFCEYISPEIILHLNGNNYELMRQQLLSILKNFVEHGETRPMFRNRGGHRDLVKEAGMTEDKTVSLRFNFSHTSNMKFDARRQKESHLEMYGTTDGFIGTWGDEYGYAALVAAREMVDIYREHGFRFAINSRYGYVAGCTLADLYWPPVTPDQNNENHTDKYHFVAPDGYFGWYAQQHVGVENPAFIRRQYGFGPYRAGLSCHFNYAHHLDGYNDLKGKGYKPMNFVYGDGGGIIDTLAWEAFREGMDDIRYATLLQKLAKPLQHSKDYRVRDVARKAMQVLAELDTDSFDLSAARLEIIRHIMALKSISK